jgi:pimeloyl-ACP methyl ester carboxylesterase
MKKYNLEEMNFIDEGQGTTILLIGGQFMTLEGWRAVVDDLKRFYRVLAIEYPNQGSSPIDLEFDNANKYAEFTLDFINYLGLKPEDIIPFGLSFGANIIKCMSIHYNKKFKAAILAGVGSYELKDYVVENYKLWLSLLNNGQLHEMAKVIFLKLYSPDFIAKNNGIIDFSVRNMVENYGHKIEALETLLKSTINYFEEVDDDIDLMKFPFDTYLIGAKNDPMMPSSYVEDYSRKIDGKFYQMDGGHIMNMEYPFEFVGVLHDIFERHD